MPVMCTKRGQTSEWNLWRGGKAGVTCPGTTHRIEPSLVDRQQAAKYRFSNTKLHGGKRTGGKRRRGVLGFGRMGARRHVLGGG